MRDDCQYIGLITLAFVLKARARQIEVYGRVRSDLVVVVAISAVEPGGSRIVLVRRPPAFSLVRALSTVMTRVLAAVFVAGTLEYFGDVPFLAGFVPFALAFLFAERIFPEKVVFA